MPMGLLFKSKMSLPREKKEGKIMHVWIYVFGVCSSAINRFERDKAEALNHQKEAMNRAFRVQLAKLLKEKEELQRKCQTLMQQSKEPNGKIQSNGMTTAAASQAAAETMKLIHENAILRNEKKKQEEQLQVA